MSPRLFRQFVLLVLLATMSFASWAAEGLRFTPMPGWVDVVDAGGIKPPPPIEGLAYLLVDDQVSVRDAQPREFRRLVYEVRDAGGLEEGGRLSISFQPDFQGIEVHALAVTRDGRVADRREAARVEILRREDRADDGILDGWRTAQILIPDVQVGDRVELAFTVIGDNPIFGGRYHSRFGTAYSQPVGFRRLRILEGARPVAWRQHGPIRLDAVESRDAVGRVIELSSRDLAGVVYEAGAPGWFSGYGAVEVGMALDWRDIAAWSHALFQHRGAAPQALAERAGALGLAGLSDADALKAALRFVQSEIRYVSLSIGDSSHAPASPDLTLERRFGDCKDKSSLLVGLLGEAGVEAQPVLVHTERGPRLQDGIPGTGAFDHAIVRARVDGEWVYVDPTRPEERGELRDREPVRFAWGLPVAAGTRGLEAIPVPEERGEALEVDVEQRMAIVGEGDDERVDFDVATTYAFGDASIIRNRFQSRGAEKIGLEYLDYMRGMYRDMEADGVPTVEDEPERNRLVVTEGYLTPMVLQEEEGGGKEINLRLFQIADWVPDEDSPARLWPLALGGPGEGRHRIRFEHDGGWNIEPESAVVENDFFRFERTVSLEGDALVVEGRWSRLADHVPAERYAAIRDDLHEVRELLDYSLSFGGDAEGGRPILPHDLALTLCALVILAATLGIAWQARARSAFAGMLFQPRDTVASRIDRDGLLPAAALLMGVAIATELLTVVPQWLADNAIDWAAVAKSALSTFPQQAMVIGLLWLGLRLTGVRAPLRQLFVASVWGMVPILLFTPLAALAAAGTSAAIAEPAVALDGPQWIVVIAGGAGLLLLFAGVIWALVATFIAYATVAGCSVRRVVLVQIAVALTIFVVVFIAVLLWPDLL